MIKIWNNKEEEKDIYLYLRTNLSPDGLSVCAKDSSGNHLYCILTIHKDGVHFHNLKNFEDTPFILSYTNLDGDKEAKRINISRL